MIARMILRILGGVLGIAAVGLAILLLSSVWHDLAREAKLFDNYPLGFWRATADCLFLAIVVLLFLSIAGLCWQYSFRTFRPNASIDGPKRMELILKSCVAGGIAVIAISMASQIIYLVITNLRIHKLPSQIRDTLRVRWSPDMWQTTKASPEFVLLICVAFVLVFGWEYRHVRKIGKRHL